MEVDHHTAKWQLIVHLVNNHSLATQEIEAYLERSLKARIDKKDRLELAQKVRHYFEAAKRVAALVSISFQGLPSCKVCSTRSPAYL